MSKNELLSFQTRHLNLEPKIHWSHWSNFIVSYQANINLTSSTVGSSKLNPLWNILQKMQLSYAISQIELKMSADHYYNEINSNTSYNNYFLDIMLRWKLDKWRFSLSVANLLDTDQYNYAEYSSIQSYSSWIDIRGREFLVGIQYRF